MDKKQADRRPGERPAEQGKSKDEPRKAESGPRMPEVPEGNKRYGQPEGHPYDKQVSKPGARGGAKDILDGDRSDRESGRPIQLEDGDERQSFPSGQPGRADAERGPGGRPEEGRAERKPQHEAEKTKR